MANFCHILLTCVSTARWAEFPIQMLSDPLLLRCGSSFLPSEPSNPSILSPAERPSGGRGARSTRFIPSSSSFPPPFNGCHSLTSWQIQEKYSSSMWHLGLLPRCSGVRTVFSNVFLMSTMLPHLIVPMVQFRKELHLQNGCSIFSFHKKCNLLLDTLAHWYLPVKGNNTLTCLNTLIPLYPKQTRAQADLLPRQEKLRNNQF